MCAWRRKTGLSSTIRTVVISSEALTNVAKHAPGASAQVSLVLDDSTLVVEVVDQGPGGADISAGTGLLGLADRVAGVGGELEVQSPSGGGTQHVARVPIASIQAPQGSR